jgi:hypothetical protein
LRRRRFLASATAALLASSHALARAAPSPPPRPRIVYTFRRTSDQLQKWYAERGLIDGRDIEFADVSFAGLSDAQAEARARKVLASDPGVVAVMGSLLARADEIIEP